MHNIRSRLVGLLNIHSGLAYVENIFIISAITSLPGIKRVYEGDSCTFQWTFTGPAFPYYFENLTTTPSSGVRGTPNIDRANGVITLTITNIALWDAGNYSLTIETTNDATALLYVYRKLSTLSSKLHLCLEALGKTKIQDGIKMYQSVWDVCLLRDMICDLCDQI